MQLPPHNEGETDMVRKAEYTAEKHKLFIDALSVGLKQRDAAAYAGIAWSTWCDWRRRVLKGDRFHAGVASLVDEHEQAAARGHAAVLAQLRKHSVKDTKAAVFLAQRRDEQDSRRLHREKMRAEIAFLKARTEALDGVKAALAGATDEELAMVASIIERSRKRGLSQSNQDRAGTTDEGDGT